MAKFNPDTRVDVGREYDFKGYDGSRALGTLLSGTADTLDKAIKGGVRAIGNNLEQDAIAGEQAIQDNLFNTGDVAVAQASTTTGGQARPEDLNRGMKEALRLKEAYVKGAIRESDYLANIDVLAKKLRTKYGAQWNNDIDAAIGNAMSNTANQFRKQLFSEWDKDINESNSTAKSRRSLVEKFPEHFAGFPEILANPENYTEGQLLGIIAPREARKWQVNQVSAEATLADKTTEAGRKTIQRALNARVQHLKNTVADVNGTPFLKVLNEKIKTFGEDKHFDEKEKGELRNYLTELKVHMQSGLNRIFSEELYIDMDEDEKKKHRASVDEEIAMYTDMVMNDKTGVMVFNLQRMEDTSQDYMNTWLKRNPNLANFQQAYGALKGMGLADLTEELSRQYLQEGVLSSDISKGGLTLAAQGLLGSDVLNEFSETLFNNPEAADPAAFLKAIEFTHKALTDDRTPLETRVNAARSLFAPSNRMFLSHFEETADVPDASRMYYSLVTPGVIETMKGMKEKDAFSWFNFRTWAIDESFNVLFKQDMDQLVDDKTARKIKYDTQKAQFTQGPPAKGTRGSEDTRRVESKEGDRQYRITQDRIDRINLWVQRVKPIIEADGLDAHEELRRIFSERGISGGQSGMFSLVNAYLKALPDEETEEGTKTKAE